MTSILGAIGIGSASEPLSAEAQALISAMSAPPAAYYQSAVNTFLNALVTAGIFSKSVAWYDLGGGPTEADSHLNMVNPGTYTLAKTGTLTWQKGIGTNTDGTTGYLDCGFAPNSLGQNDLSAHAFVYSTAATGTNHMLGVASGTNFRFGLFNSATGAIALVNSTTAINAAVPPARLTDIMTSVIRRASNQSEIWMEGVLTRAASATSSTPSSGNFWIFRNGSTGYSLSSTTLRLVGICQSLNSVEMAALNAAVVAFTEATRPRYFAFMAAGQSNMSLIFLNPVVIGSGDGTANTDANTRILKPYLQAALDAQYSDGRGNILSISDDSDIGSTILGTTAGVEQQHVWWNIETDAPMLQLTQWATSSDAFIKPSRRYQIQIAWAQGESDVGASAGLWKEATQQVLAWMRAHLGDPTTPIIIHPIGRNSDFIAQIRVSRREQAEIDVADAYLVLGPEVMDISRRAANDWHATNDYSPSVINPATGYDRMASYVARAAAAQWGCNVAWRGPEVVSAAKTGSTTILVTITYPAGCEGTDFTPTSAIEGFRVVDDGGEKTINSAARVSATTILLTVSTALSTNPTVAYDNISTTFDRTKMIRDNATFPMPMRWSGFIAVAV